MATQIPQSLLMAAMVTLAGAGSAIALDASASSRQKTTLTESSTMAAFSNPPYDGYAFILAVRQGGSGSYTLGFNANVRYSSAVTSITLSTTVGATDYIGFIWDDEDQMWTIIAFAAAV